VVTERKERELPTIGTVEDKLQRLMTWDKPQLALAAQQRDELLVDCARAHVRIAELEKLSVELVILLAPALQLATTWRGLVLDPRLAMEVDEPLSDEQMAIACDAIWDEVDDLAIAVEKLSEAGGPLAAAIERLEKEGAK
jgi:tetrahydromethanopterin S-methyltransferase subunit B